MMPSGGVPRRPCARKNDVHVPLCFGWAQRLLAGHPEADRDIVSPTILLHDAVWSSIDMQDNVERRGFGPDMMQSGVRFLHACEGVRLSRPVLAETGWPEAIILAVAEIIDGHDSRPAPRHLHDRLVRDADRLWRVRVPGVSVACDRLGSSAARLRLPERAMALKASSWRHLMRRSIACHKWNACASYLHPSCRLRFATSLARVRENAMKTQVAILGGGPSGFLLSQLLLRRPDVARGLHRTALLPNSVCLGFAS
jgi:hypothetical protein